MKCSNVNINVVDKTYINRLTYETHILILLKVKGQLDYIKSIKNSLIYNMHKLRNKIIHIMFCCPTIF